MWPPDVRKGALSLLRLETFYIRVAFMTLHFYKISDGLRIPKIIKYFIPYMMRVPPEEGNDVEVKKCRLKY